MKKVGVAILGLGVVGGGTYRILLEHREFYQRTQGLDLTVESVLEPDEGKIAALGIDRAIVASNIAEVVCNPDVQIIVECIGGEGVARDYVLAALYAGKTVVTSNKLLYAKHSDELERAARQHHAGLQLEASCMGGVPIVRTLLNGLQANVVGSMMGIVNGTTNYILSKMTEEGAAYEEALAQARQLGYAEADPESDLEGFDSVYKLSILASLAFHTKVPADRILREGLSKVSKDAIGCAKQLGYVIKLLAVGKQTKQGIEVRVHPAFVPKEHPLAGVGGCYNAIFLHGDSVGDVMLYGEGAGALPTGSAMVSDIIYAANHYENISSSRISVQEKPKLVTDFCSAYFLRLELRDAAEGLSKVTALFAKKGISVKKLSRVGADGKRILLVTEEVQESVLFGALEKLRESGIAETDMRLRAVS